MRACGYIGRPHQCGGLIRDSVTPAPACGADPPPSIARAASTRGPCVSQAKNSRDARDVASPLLLHFCRDTANLYSIHKLSDVGRVGRWAGAGQGVLSLDIAIPLRNTA